MTINPALRIPEGFASADGILLVGGKPVTAWVEAAGTPLFLYDSAHICTRVDQLRHQLPSCVDIHYAMKANPHGEVVRLLSGLTDGIDVASHGELAIALNNGACAAHISMAGPGKSDLDIRKALEAGVLINLESEREAARVAAAALHLGVGARVAVRINPAFDIKGAGLRMGGRPQPFGVDAARVPALLAKLKDQPFDFEGFHVYAGSQMLNAEQISHVQAQTLELITSLLPYCPLPPRRINIGGGFGVPYFSGDTALDIEAVGAVLHEHISALPAVLHDAKIILELGRYLVAEAGVYVCRIIDRKDSYGETFLITDGGLHHQLAASGQFGQVLRRNYPVAIANRLADPLGPPVTVTGCLCTPLDRLADKLALPEAEPGDLVAVFMAGAYGASASPASFLGHPAAQEMLV